MGITRRGIGRCCFCEDDGGGPGPDPCVHHEDNFDGDSLDMQWVEAGGPWSASGGEAVADDAGSLTWSVPHEEPDTQGNPGQSATVVVTNPVVGQQSTVYVFWTDGSNYLGARLTHEAAGSGLLEIIEVSGGAAVVKASQAVSFDTLATISVAVCYSGGILSGYAVDALNNRLDIFSEAIADQPPSARKAGFSFDRAGTADTFRTRKVGGGCPACDVRSTCNTTPLTAVMATIPAAIVGGGDCQDTIAGTYQLRPTGVVCQWGGEFIVPPHDVADPGDPPAFTKLSIVATWDEVGVDDCQFRWNLRITAETSDGMLVDILTTGALNQPYVCMSAGLVGVVTFTGDATTSIGCLGYDGRTFAVEAQGA